MTILFANDWLRFPRAIVDYETKNTSFKRMVSLYKEMGVQNCLWPLSLLQPELQGIDPYAEDLSDETKVLIGLECRWNFWYYLREVARIPPIAGPSAVSYIANRGNLTLSWTFLNNIDIALIQPRQTGKSVSTDCIMIWLLYIGANNTVISMLTKDHTVRTKNVERLKRIRDYLPKYLLNITSKDSDNQTDLTCVTLGNSYITGVGQNSESAANNLMRGLTSPVTHIDEGPSIRFIGTSLPVTLSTGTTARLEAEKYGRPYGNIFTTTAGKKDGRDGRYMYDLIFGGAVWNELFLDAENKEDLKHLVKRNCSGRKALVNATFSHRQLGKSDKWLYDAISNSGCTPEEADRDFFNIWTSGSQSSPLSVQVNETIHNSEIDPVYTEISKDSYIIRWYLKQEELYELMETTHLILGLDTSDAIGRDAIAMVFTSSKDLSIVGTAVINETNLIRFSHFLADVLIKYPEIVLIPERKSSAQSIIDSLLISLPRAGIDPFRRIYNSVVDQKDEHPKDYQEIQVFLGRRNNSFYDKWKKSFGFNTTAGSRELLYSTVLQNAAKEAGHLIKDRTVSNEIRGLVVKNGRIDHSNGAHDDTVIAWLMTHWMLTYSKNLSYYGIDTRNALSMVHHEGRILNPEEHFELELQARYKEEVESIYDELTKATDEYLITRLESKLMAINAKIKFIEQNAMSIDSMINQAAMARDFSSRKRAADQHRAHYSEKNTSPYSSSRYLGR